MRTKAFLLSAALLLFGAGLARAAQYPPGNGMGCPPAAADTLIKVEFIQNPDLPSTTCHPVPPDTVWGIGGIITGFDPIATGFAIYIQNSQGGPWSGVDVFTGGTNYIPLYGPSLAIGDSIVAYGRIDEFGGETELRGFNTSGFNDPLPVVRRISTGNPLPPFHRTTVSELQELPTNPNAEQWEGCLVRVKDKLRVVRTSDTGGLDNTSAFLAVDHTLCPPGSMGPCDTLFVDGATLASPSVIPPTVNSIADSVQGIYNERTRGYRIQLRGTQDLFGSFPPGLADAYAISNDTVRVVFDRELTLASAENEANYTLASTLGQPDMAIQQPVDKRVVHLKVTNGLAACAAEAVTANGLVSLVGAVTMTTAATRNFRNGICPIASIQAPNPDSLAAMPCLDRSLYAGAGGAPGGRITTRGVCTITFGSDYFIQTQTGGARSGIVVFAPATPLVAGREYILAGAVQEFFGETEFAGTVFIRPLTFVTAPPLFAGTVPTMRDTTCDKMQNRLTGEDYEGALVQVDTVKVTFEIPPGGPGAQFMVAGPYPTVTDTMLVDNDRFRTFDPQFGRQMRVRGVLDVSFGNFRIQPRNDGDFLVYSLVGVENPLPAGVDFSISPNPARSARVTFALPQRDRVRITVYDVAGRLRAVLADGEYPAGTHTMEWNGKDLEDHAAGSGVYFYRLRIAGKDYDRRAVLLN